MPHAFARSYTRLQNRFLSDPQACGVLQVQKATPHRRLSLLPERIPWELSAFEHLSRPPSSPAFSQTEHPVRLSSHMLPTTVSDRPLRLASGKIDSSFNSIIRNRESLYSIGNRQLQVRNNLPGTFIVTRLHYLLQGWFCRNPLFSPWDTEDLAKLQGRRFLSQPDQSA